MSTTMRTKILVIWAAVMMATAAAACGATPVATKAKTTTTTTVPGEPGTKGPPPGTARPPATTTGRATSTTTALPTTAPPTTTPAGSAAKVCTISAVSAIAAESTGVDEARTASWALLSANGWTVVAPNQDWHLSASDGGADVLSPDGTADASVSTWPAQTPWTMATLGQKVLGSVSNFAPVCSTEARSATSSTQATEFTGDYQGESIHGIIILGLLTPTTPDLYVGEIRSMYTSASQWSASAAQTLMLIIKRAIEDPQSLNP